MFWKALWVRVKKLKHFLNSKQRYVSFIFILDRSLMIASRTISETLKGCPPYSLSCFFYLHIGPILMIASRTIIETLKGCPRYSLSCVSVCAWTTEHAFWPRNLIFVLSVPWEMKKKHIFCLWNFHFYAFHLHFSFFPLYRVCLFRMFFWSMILSIHIKPPQIYVLTLLLDSGGIHIIISFTFTF